jgi:uncharacterized lipoprotein YddW (UPF0748 family)
MWQWLGKKSPSVEPISKPAIQGVWIANLPHSQVLASPENIRQALGFLQEIGFNTIFPVVWNRGYTLFPSRVMQNYGFPNIDPFFAEKDFNPLLFLTKYAREYQLKIIPWFEYGFAASPLENGGHILVNKPHWTAINAQGNKVKSGGLIWMNSLDMEVQEFLLTLILEVAKNYDIDGIQGCDRLPALPKEAGYNSDIIQRYQQEFNLSKIPNFNDVHWRQWRADILTNFLTILYQEIKAINPRLILSLSPAVYPFCLDNLLQDSLAWVNKQIVDYLHPQIYRDSYLSYQAEAKKQQAFFCQNNSVVMAPGIAFTANKINLSLQDIKNILACNHRLGFQGQVFFHYEGLQKDQRQMALVIKNFYS